MRPPIWLKGFITGTWIRINPKNVSAHDERNHVNVVFLSNERQPLVLEKDDRRYTVIWTPGELGAQFYDEVRREIEANSGRRVSLGAIYATLDSRTDVDYFTFDGKKGQTILLSIVIPQIAGQEQFAPEMALLGPGLGAASLPARVVEIVEALHEALRIIAAGALARMPARAFAPSSTPNASLPPTIATPRSSPNGLWIVRTTYPSGPGYLRSTRQ